MVNRFKVPAAEQDVFREALAQAQAALAARDGFVNGTIGRNLDDPELWLLTTEWDNVGAYRRALSSYDVKLAAVPTLSRAIDEPSAYEAVLPDTDLNINVTRSLG